jgi:CubicO group peptidase (beta-lactamase class C family)
MNRVSWEARLHRDMLQAVEEQAFPGGVLLVSRNGEVLFEDACGLACLDDRSPVTASTFFDLASLTKPLATTLAVLALVKEGAFSFDSRLGELHPLCDNSDKAPCTLEQLLLHTAGLPAHRHYYRELVKRPPSERHALLDVLLRDTPLESPPGTEVVYSDLGFMLLRGVVERAAGMPLDEVVQQRVYEPAGIGALCYRRLPLARGEKLSSFAATSRCPWRGKLLRGEVEDDNCWALGGVDGQAGLFGTARGVHHLLSLLLGIYCGKATHPALSREMLHRIFDPARYPGRTPGFDRPAAQGSAAGCFFSRYSVGHLGFTGTSFWLDLARGIGVVLLTNRVHPTRKNDRLQAFRPRVHDRVMGAFRQELREP